MAQPVATLIGPVAQPANDSFSVAIGGPWVSALLFLDGCNLVNEPCSMIHFIHDRPLIDQPAPASHTRQVDVSLLPFQDRDASRMLTFRSFDPADQAQVQRLYTHGLLTRQIEPFDPAADLDNMDHTYSPHSGGRAWVVECRQRIVGLAAVASNKAHEVELRRLLVDAGRLHNRVVDLLLGHVLEYCRRHNVLKILLSASMDSPRNGQLFNDNGYHCTRHKVCRGRPMAEFYINLYQKMPREARSA